MFMNYSLIFSYSVLPERTSPIEMDEEAKISPIGCQTTRSYVALFEKPSLCSLAIFLHYIDEARLPRNTFWTRALDSPSFLLRMAVEEQKKIQRCKEVGINEVMDKKNLKR